MSTIKTTYIQHPSAATPSITLNADGSIGSISLPPDNKPNLVNTDGNPGNTIYVGSTDPNISYTLVSGDIWIEVSA